MVKKLSNGCDVGVFGVEIQLHVKKSMEIVGFRYIVKGFPKRERPQDMTGLTGPEN